MIRSNDAKITIYLEKISFLILRLDEFWCYQNNRDNNLSLDLTAQYHDFQKARTKSLPRGLSHLQKSTANLKELAKVARSWSNAQIGYIPTPCLKTLYLLIIDMEEDRQTQVEEKLKQFNEEIEDYLYLTAADWFSKNVKPGEKWEEVEKRLKEYAEYFLRLGTDKDINDFLALFPKLAQNQKGLTELMSSSGQEAAPLYVTRGMLFKDRDLGKYSRQAIQCFTQAITLNSNPDSTAIALARRAEIYLAKGDVLQGLGDLAKACQTVEAPEIFVQYGSALITEQRYLEAIEWLKRALLLRPQNCDIQALLQKALTEGRPSFSLFQEIQNLIAICQDLTRLAQVASGREQHPLWLEASMLRDLKLMMYLSVQTNPLMQDTEGNTAIHHIARLGYLHLLDFLISLRLNLNATNKFQQTPLFLAARHGKVSMLNALLARGASVGVADRNVLQTAIVHGQSCVLESLFNHSSYEELLRMNGGIVALFQMAIDARQLCVLQVLIEHYPEVLYVKEKPLLHYAVEKRYADGVQLLVKSGADVEQVNAQNQTAYQLAQAGTDNEALVLQEYLAREIQKVQHVKENMRRNLSLLINAVTAAFKNIKPRDLKNIFYEVIPSIPAALHWLQQDSYPGERLSREIVEKLKLELDIFEVLKVTPKIIQEVLSTFNYSSSAGDAPEESKVSVASRTSEEINGQRHTSLVFFCEHFEEQMDAAYSYFTAVASGEIATIQDERIMAQMSLVPSIPLQGICLSKGDADYLDLPMYLRQFYRKKEAEQINRVFKPVSPFQRMYFIRCLAWQLAERYKAHIMKFPAKTIRQFADCIAARFIEYVVNEGTEKPALALNKISMTELLQAIQSGHIGQSVSADQQRQKSLYDKLLFTLALRPSCFPGEHDQLCTMGNVQKGWSTQGILEKTGIVTSSGIYYARSYGEICRYGYCQSEETEGNSRGLTTRNPLTGALWMTEPVHNVLLARILDSLKNTEAMNVQSPTSPSISASPLDASVNQPVFSSPVNVNQGVSVAVTPKKVDHLAELLGTLRSEEGEDVGAPLPSSSSAPVLPAFDTAKKSPSPVATPSAVSPAVKSTSPPFREISS